MQKVFHFEAPREKYQCDAAIVWCFDNRFELGFRKFLKRIGVENATGPNEKAILSARFFCEKIERSPRIQIAAIKKQAWDGIDLGPDEFGAGVFFDASHS